MGLLCEGKVALVTGGASGIGRATAIAFAREGASVVVADVNAALGAELVDFIVASGATAIFVETDVTSESAIVSMVEQAVSTFGGLDAAFNNAGTAGSGTDALGCTEEEWRSVIDLNLRSVWLCMKHEIPEMLERGGGAIVNTASRAGDSASQHMVTYVATKHGVVGLTRSAALDFAAQNVRVNALLPGFTDTPMLRRGGSILERQDVGKTRVPMKRIGRPEEQAEAAVWLCSDRASFVTGTTLTVDGGMSASI
jgi:NAD(P)-dependent dehydrogenase (short-subunit alcohol dehydrogenase family)